MLIKYSHDNQEEFLTLAYLCIHATFKVVNQNHSSQLHSGRASSRAASHSNRKVKDQFHTRKWYTFSYYFLCTPQNTSQQTLGRDYFQENFILYLISFQLQFTYMIWPKIYYFGQLYLKHNLQNKDFLVEIVEKTSILLSMYVYISRKFG